MATAGGLVSALPLLLASGATGTTAALSLLSTVASCFLFGVTYRFVCVLGGGGGGHRGALAALCTTAFNCGSSHEEAQGGGLPPTAAC